MTAPGPENPVPKRRVGRPRRSEGPAVTREQILREATTTLMAHGMAGFVLRDIARRLGVTLPTLQLHFRTKDELYRACIDEIVARIPVTPDSGLADRFENAAPLLSNIVGYLVERTISYPRATPAMWSDDEPGGEERLHYLFERAAPRADVARQNLAAAIAAEVFRPIDADVFIALIGLGVSSIATSPYALRQMFGIDLEDEEDRRRLVDALTDLLVNGLVARKAGEPPMHLALQGAS